MRKKYVCYTALLSWYSRSLYQQLTRRAHLSRVPDSVEIYN